MEFQLVFLTDDKIICYKTSREGYLKLLLHPLAINVTLMRKTEVHKIRKGLDALQGNYFKSHACINISYTTW